VPSRRTWTVVGGVAALVVVGAVGGPLVYAALQEDAAPATTVQAQDSDAPLVETTDGTWTVSSGSSAGYRVDEVLNGADVTVAGTTDQVTGTVTVEGDSVTAATIDVDVASIATDSGNRDGYFRDDAMEASTYPTATFVLTQPIDAGVPADGDVETVEATGDLTMHGVTQSVTVSLQAALSGDGVQISGSVPVTFSDYGVEAPSFGFVQVEDSGTVEFLVSATPAS